MAAPRPDRHAPDARAALPGVPPGVPAASSRLLSAPRAAETAPPAELPSAPIPRFAPAPSQAPPSTGRFHALGLVSPPPAEHLPRPVPPSPDTGDRPPLTNWTNQPYAPACLLAGDQCKRAKHKRSEHHPSRER